MAFTFDLNLTPTTFADAMFQIKARLKLAGWVHQSSSDGVASFTTTPGNVNDVITTSGAGPGGLSNALAWFTLKHPGSPREICFQRGGSQPVVNWDLTSQPTFPTQRAYAAACYFPPSGKLILFGGAQFGQPESSEGQGVTPFYSQTWSYDVVTRTWTLLTPGGPTPPARANHAMVYSPNLGKIVMFGGSWGGTDYNNDTYTFDGTNWALVTPGTSPSARRSHAMALDPVTGDVLLFGGRAADYPALPLSDTWTFNGTTWTSHSPAHVPPGREMHSMANYTGSLTHHVVMFSGGDRWTTSWFNDTWTWDGTDWTAQSPAQSPIGRFLSTMVPTDSTVNGWPALFGGYTSALAPERFATNYGSSDTWLWNGTNWLHLTTTYPPDAFAAVSSGFDTTRHTFIFTGGSPQGNYPNSLLTWQGTFADIGDDYWYIKYSVNAGFAGGSPSLTQVPSASDEKWLIGKGPDNAPTFVQMSGDDGLLTYNIVTDTASPYGFWAGGYGPPLLGWNNLYPYFQNEETAMVFDNARNVVVEYGGGPSGTDTYEWINSGGYWSFISTTGTPPPLRDHGMAYDSAADRTWLYGGEYGSNSNQTWEYNGHTSTWTQHVVSGPGPRTRLCLAYDISRNKTVMFGGYNAGYFNDTWEWNGSAWTHVVTAHSPGVRAWASMCFDSVRNVMVLWGGTGNPDGNGGVYSDTWTYDGTDWTQHFPVHSPRPKYGSAIAFDSVRGVVRLVGGQVTDTAAYQANEVWEWDGTDWTHVTVSGSNFPLSPSAPGFSNQMVYDGTNSRFLVLNQNGYEYPSNAFHQGGMWASYSIAAPGQGFMIFDPITTPLAADNDPFVIFVNHTQGGLTDIQSYNTPNSYADFPDYNNAQAAGAWINYGVSGRQAFGAMFLASYDVGPGSFPAGGGTLIPNGNDGNMELFPAFWFGDYNDVAYGFKGKSSLILCPAQQTSPQPWTAGPTQLDYIVFENRIALPWDGLTVPTGTGGQYDGRIIDVTTPDQMTEALEDFQTQQLLAPTGGGGAPLIGSALVRGGS